MVVVGASEPAMVAHVPKNPLKFIASLIMRLDAVFTRLERNE